MPTRNLLRAGRLAIVLGLAAPLLVACGDEPAEEAGQAMEEGGDEAEEAVD